MWPVGPPGARRGALRFRFAVCNYASVMPLSLDAGGPAPAKKLGLPQVAADDVKRFHEQGFLAVERFTTAEDLERIKALLGELYRRFRELPPRHAVDLGDEAQPDGAPQIPEINWALELAPKLRTTLAFARCGAVAEQLLGCRAIHTGYDHAILKPPHNERATAWHQDQAYTEDRGPLSSVHFWIPMHDVTVEMGCMHFVPGSHLGPLVPHQRRGGRAHAMEAETVDGALAVACPLPAGGATVHLPRTLHYSGPNRTDRPRLAWSLEFGPPRTRWWRRYLGALSRSMTVTIGIVSLCRATRTPAARA